MRTKTSLGILFAILLVFSAFTIAGTSFRTINNNSFGTGENLVYRVHYGLLNAAEAKLIIRDDIYTLNGRPCYKIDVYGKSVGVFDMMMRVRDNWGTYMDTSAVVPHKFYRFIEEGKYRKNEIVEFDHYRNLAITKLYEKHDKNLLKKELSHEVPSNIQDLVSGYYFLRTIDYTNLKTGDIVSIHGFFDEEIFDLKLKIRGRERLKTKLGKIKALKLQPIMPDNKMFDGKNSILIWLSDDENKIPLKIRAKMFIGAVEIDIKSQKGLKNPLAID